MVFVQGVKHDRLVEKEDVQGIADDDNGGVGGSDGDGGGALLNLLAIIK